MNIPKIDIGSLPGLDTATGVFGSVMQSGVSYDDGVVAVMVYVYDNVPTDSLF